MAGTLEVLHIARPVEDDERCSDCVGSLVTVDGGELSGLPGALVPCICVPSFDGRWEWCTVPSGVPCACWMARWPFNGGHTGLVPLAPEEFDDDGPLYRPCPVHAVARASLAVAG
ncbi:hypothetical protein ACFU93_07790 [Streptomyces sp. NPDC057611]|uniref:hypothetical protein n=1 Tax=Streptomyces sp. NPDC057611 TaxID=3346182 RepID=UPI0036BCE7A8